MKEIIKKTFLRGLGAASLTKNQAEKTIKELVKRNSVTIKEGKAMLGKIKKAANSERIRVQKFAEQEVRRITGKLSISSKSQIGKIKKRLTSINKELSSRGKKTLRKIMKELSR